MWTYIAIHIQTSTSTENTECLKLAAGTLHGGRFSLDRDKALLSCDRFLLVEHQSSQFPLHGHWTSHVNLQMN